MRDRELQESKLKVSDLETELRKQEFETQRVHEQKTLQNDA